jgi:hypothetical protein
VFGLLILVAIVFFEPKQQKLFKKKCKKKENLKKNKIKFLNKKILN